MYRIFNLCLVETFCVFFCQMPDFCVNFYPVCCFSEFQIACFIDSELEIKLAAKAPKSNIIRRVIEEKTVMDKETGKRCIYNSVDYNFSTEDKFSIMSRNEAIAILILLNSFKSNNIVWFNSNPLYQTNLFFYLRKGDKDGKRFKRM